MMQIIVLLGKSCSGKTKIQKELVKLGLTPIILYTTRPPGQGESNGARYHFVSERKFYQLFLQGFFGATTSIKVHSGDVWRYGIALNDIEEASVVIGNPQSISVLCALKFAKPVVFYIDILEDIIYERMKANNYAIDEIQGKMVNFREEFEHVEHFMNYRITNDGLVGMDELAQQIYELYGRHIV